MDLRISIVTYNNKKEVIDATIKCVLQSDLDLELWVIDNDSNVAPDFSSFDDRRLHFFRQSKNIGFGRAHNIALRKSLEDKVPFHLVLNPDVTFEPGTLEEILQYMSAHPEVGNLQPEVRFPDGQFQYLCKALPTPLLWFGRRFLKNAKFFQKINHDFELRFWNYDSIAQIPYLSGCFMFLNIKALEQIGLFDEKIFLYGEDCDLSRRIYESSFENIYYPATSIKHLFAKGSHKDQKLMFIAIKSSFYYFKKWGWLLDKKRKIINKNLKTLLHKKSES